jgi:quercetin dioxygenase-like cupin family protein
MKTIFAATGIFVLMTGLAQAADAPKPPPGVTSVLVTDATKTVSGQPIEVPSNPHVLVTITTIAPGAHLPAHVHPYARYAYIMEGAITVTNLETHETYVSKAGDFVVDLHNQLHSAVNAGTVPVKVLTIDQVPAGVSTNMVVKQP